MKTKDCSINKFKYKSPLALVLEKTQHSATVNIKLLKLIIYEPKVRYYLKEKYKQIIQNVLVTFYLHVTIYNVTDCYILVHLGSFFQALTVIERWPVCGQISCSSTPWLNKPVTAEARVTCDW